MAEWGGVMGWEEWSARYVERELPQRSRMTTNDGYVNPKAQKEVEESFVGSIWSWVSGRKRREREEELKHAKKAHEDPERRRRWYWNFHQESDLNAKPVNRFSWSRYDDCWSAETINHALVCADQEAPVGLAGAVFAVGTPLAVTRADKMKQCIEVLRCNPSAGFSHWHQIYPDDETLQDLPTSKEGRYEFSCCYYDGKIFMFGGSFGQQVFKDMECFDIATGSWNALETFVDGCSHPKAHCGHASTSNDNIMYIHGGWPKDGQPSLGNFFEEFTAGLLSFDMATLTWKEVTPNYHQPPSGGLVGIPLPDNYMHLLRDHHSLEYVDGRLIMFGGRGPEIATGCMISGQPECVEGFFEFNLSTKRWGRLLTTGYSPQTREMVASARCGGSILYYGGYKTQHYRSRDCFSDLFMLDTDTYHITLVEPFGTGPGPRMTSMCAVGSSVMFLGGATGRARDEPHHSTDFPFQGHSDMFLLSTIPSLQQICVVSIAEGGLDCSLLPPRLQDLVYTQRVE